MSAFLEIKEISAGYASRTILSKLSLEVQPGEILGIIGPNGCGKSTLIKTVSGVLKPKSGQVLLEGRDLLAMKADQRARVLAVVAQNPSLPAAFTAAEIVLMGRTPHLGAFQQEGPEDWRIVQEAMEAANCWEMAQRPVGELSGGERQRVLFALALAQQPRLLLLDEPTTYLDINYQVGVMDIALEWLQSAPDRGALAVFHDLNLAAQYCKRLALLSTGQVVAFGNPNEVITEANIRRAYGASVIIAPHPLNNLPTTFILPRNSEKGINH
ncbi:MAG TPA: ABC transporter ATP-binding protein [Chloroflexia bacterium]|nr:ABC transporter ATP-binding protein [Chloroflexia bacterium]